MNRFLCLCMAAAVSLLLSGCNSAHGQPQENSESIAPSETLDFDTLYVQNCAGCHGAHGRGGAAIALADPVYLAIVSEASMRKAVAQGVHGTSMPAFARSAGGLLTENQIDVITKGIAAHWAQKDILDGSNPPPYAQGSPGSSANGELVYQTYCAHCHGADGRGAPKGSAITDDSFLALISNQGLRTIVIAGRPELGAPDWRGNVPGRPMSDQEITDVVAWLASKRATSPGQPYPAALNKRP